MLWKNPGTGKDHFICFPEIELIFTIRLFIEDLRPETGRKYLPECVNDLASYLVAGLADGRSDTGQDILRAAFVYFRHLPHRLFSDTGNRSTPSRMGKPDDSSHRIYKKERYAVCVKGNKAKSRHIRNQSVDIVIICRTGDTLAPVCLRNDTNMIRMSLSGKNHIGSTDADSLPETSKIFHDGRFLIAP